MMRILLACVVDFLRHGPNGGPALARHDTYRWLHRQTAGRLALWVVWVGLGATGAMVPLPPAVQGRGMTLIKQWSPARAVSGAPWHPSLQRGQDHDHRTPQHA